MKLALSAIILSSALALGAVACRSSATLENANQTSSKENTNNAEPQTATGGVERFRIDARQSQVTAHIGVGGLLSALGHDHTVAIRDFSGEAQVTSVSLEPASLQLTINASSLAETDKEFSDSDRRKIDRAIQEEALETAKYPQIVFKSTKVSAKKTGDGQYQVQIEGELALHGVTRAITIPAQVSVSGDTVSARGEFTVRHSDYQIKRISAGGGTVIAKEEITLSCNIVGTKI